MKHSAKQLRDLSPEQLDDLLRELRGELRQHRFLAKHGELKEVHKMQEIKKTIARILTVKSRLTDKEKQG